MIFVLTAILSLFLWVNAASAYVITYIGTDSGFVTSGTSITKAYTITSTGADERKVLVAKIAYNSPGANDAPTSVVWNSQNFSLVSGTQSLNNGRSTEIWILPLGDTASNTNSNVVVTFAGTVSARLIIEEYNNVKQDAPIVSGGVATGTSTSPAIAVTPVHTDDMVIDVWHAATAGCGSPCSVGTDQTSTFYNAGDGNYADAVGTSREPPLTDPGVGNHHSYDGYSDMTWTQTSSAAWVVSGATLRVYGITNVRFGTSASYCNNNTNSIGSATYSTQTGNNKVIVYIIRWYSASAQTVSSASWNSQSFSSVSGAVGAGSFATAIYLLKLGSHTAVTDGAVAISFSGSVYACVGIFEVDNVDQTTSTHNGTSTASVQDTNGISLTVGSVVESDLIVGGASADNISYSGEMVGIDGYTLGAGQVRFSYGLHAYALNYYLLGSKQDGTYEQGSANWGYDLVCTGCEPGATTSWGGAAAALKYAASGSVKPISRAILL